MRLSHLVLSLGTVVALGGVMYACSSSEDTPPAATGGSTGTGGAATGGGAGATGGTVTDGGGGKGGGGTGGGGTGGTVDAGGDGSSPGIASLVPAGTEITGWTASTVSGYPQIATTYQGAIDAIDGTAEPFYTDSFKAVALGHQKYMRTLSDGAIEGLDYYLWQMPSAAIAQQLYAALPSNSDQLWVECTTTLTPVIGDRAVYGIKATAVHMLIQKGAYLLDIKDLNVGIPLADVVAFATAVAAKIP